MSRPLVCIVGPTASGKSELAEDVAVALGTSVISVDAMQVYRGMDVGTAKVPVAERRCPLEMVDVADVSEDYSVRMFQDQARACVDAAVSAGRVPVLCGGSGLYLDAVIDEMEFPAGSAGGDSRRRYETIAAERGPAALHGLLRSRDPESAARIHPNNVRRVVRALELSDEGVSYARQHEGLRSRPSHYDARIWGLAMGRDRLYARIDSRVDGMFAGGLVDEARGLSARGLGDALTSKQAIGYREALDTLAGRLSTDEARELTKRRTRRYAKRQISWLKRDGRVRWLDMDVLTTVEAARRVLDDLAGDPIVDGGAS